MQWSRRHLTPQEIDHELIWLLVSLGVFLGLAAWVKARLPTPQCAFYSLTGLPCLTCGATRSALRFLHGDFLTALRFNPLAFLTYCGIAVFDLYAIVVLITRGPRFRLANFSRSEKRLVRMLAIVLLTANWLYLLIVYLN